MKRRTAERLTSLYPKAWRARFGPEFVELLEKEPFGPLLLLDVASFAAFERLFNLSGLETHAMTPYPTRVIALAKRPSGFVPLLMSLTALAIVLWTLATAGPVRQADEGAAAHLFQLLVAGEVPLLGFFLWRWLRQDARAALTLLAVHASAIGLAVLPVWYFGL